MAIRWSFMRQNNRRQNNRCSGPTSNSLEGGPAMMKSSSGLAAKGIERVLELSADAQINRRAVAEDSPAFHNFTGAIAAYGKVLALLTALQQREEFYTIVGQFELSERRCSG
jgi:hypothetical protein